MAITNSFFNAAESPVPIYCNYAVPSPKAVVIGYALAEYEAARRAIRHAFAEPDWDGYGALPVRDETKGNALAVLNQLEVSTCAPEITPNPNGTLSFEWETSQGFGQLEIGRTRFSFCLQPRHGSPILDTGDTNEIDPSIGSLLDALLYPRPTNPISSILR